MNESSTTTTDSIFPKIAKPKSPALFSIPGEAEMKAESEKAAPPAEENTEAAPEPKPAKTEKPMSEAKTPGRKRATERLCPRCMKTKPIEEFPLIKKDDPKQRRRPRCIPCWPEYQKEYRADKLKKGGKKKAKKKVAKKAKAAKTAGKKKTAKKKVAKKDPRKIAKIAKAKAATRRVAKKKLTRKKVVRKALPKRRANDKVTPVTAASSVLKDLMSQRKALNKKIAKAEKHLAKVEKWWTRGQAFIS